MTRLFSDHRGVSSVISVILMVAATVILASTVSVFALSIGESVSADAPVASFSAEQDVMRLQANYYAGDFYVLNITHTNGDLIPKDQLEVRVNGKQAWGVNNAGDGASSLLESSSSLRAGDTITVVHKDDSSLTISNGDGYTINQLPYSTNPTGDRGDNDPEKNRLFLDGHDRGPQLQLEPGDRIKIVWESERGDETAVLFEREIESIN